MHITQSTESVHYTRCPLHKYTRYTLQKVNKVNITQNYVHITQSSLCAHYTKNIRCTVHKVHKVHIRQSTQGAHNTNYIRCTLHKVHKVNITQSTFVFINVIYFRKCHAYILSSTSWIKPTLLFTYFCAFFKVKVRKGEILCKNV